MSEILRITQSTETQETQQSVTNTYHYHPKIAAEITAVSAQTESVLTDHTTLKLQVIISTIKESEIREPLVELMQLNLLTYYLETSSIEHLSKRQKSHLINLQTELASVDQDRLSSYLQELKGTLNLKNKINLSKLTKKAQRIKNLLQIDCESDQIFEFIYHYEYYTKMNHTTPDRIITGLVECFFNKQLKNCALLYEILEDIDNKTDKVSQYVLSPESKMPLVLGIPNSEEGRQNYIYHYETVIKYLILLTKTGEIEKLKKQGCSQQDIDDHISSHLNTDQQILNLLKSRLPEDAVQILPDIVEGKMNFKFLPECPKETCQYLIDLLRNSKAPINELESNYLYTLKFLAKHISFAIENQAKYNPNKAEFARQDLITKLEAQEQLLKTSDTHEYNPENTVNFKGFLTVDSKIINYEFIVGPNKTENSKLRKNEKTGTGTIQDIIRCTVLVDGSSADLQPEQINQVTVTLFSFVASFLGDTALGVTKSTFGNPGANQFSNIRFAKRIFKHMTTLETGEAILHAVEIQVKFKDDEVQSHEEYSNKQLSAVFHKNFPSYKSTILNKIHYLTVNTPFNISDNIEHVERQTYLWNLASVLHFLNAQDERTTTLRNEVLGMKLKKDNKAIQYAAISAGQTVRETLQNVLTTLEVRSFTTDDMTFLAERSLVLNNSLLQVAQDTCF